MKMIKVLAVGLVLFAVAAGASYFLLLPKSTVSKSDPPEKTEEHKEPAAEKTLHPSPGGPNEAAIEKSSPMPVSLSVANEKPVSLETLLKLAEAIRSKELQMAEREQQRLREEQRLNLLFEDLKKEQQELMGLGETIDAKITAAKQILEQVKQERAAFQAEQKAAGVTKTDTKRAASKAPEADPEQERVEKIRDWFQALEADKAARFLKEFANNGDLDLVCKLLQELDSKQSAKILASMDDPALVASIVGRLGTPKN